ncbi:MAG: 50S ribosomal protein L16 [Candidatus Bilamarchaeaceae archaeon]
MGLRPARCVREPKKVAWTRFSKKKPRKSFIKTMPHKELNVHRMGAEKGDYNAVYHLAPKQAIVMRDNALESARQSANKVLETRIPGNYYFIVRPYPHHIMRENKMVAGAGADRIQKGMRQSFGKPTDRAAILRKGQEVFTVYTYKGKENEEAVRLAFRRAKMKLSGDFSIWVG